MEEREELKEDIEREELTFNDNDIIHIDPNDIEKIDAGSAEYATFRRPTPKVSDKVIRKNRKKNKAAKQSRKINRK